MRVLLTTEGTYPFFGGGVSTWADALVTGLPQHAFTVAAIVPNPHVRPRYQAPANTRVLPVPLWGAERVEEYIDGRSGGAVRSTTRAAIRRGFLPALDELVGELLIARANAETIGRCLGALAAFCVDHDLRTAFRDERVWSVVLGRLSSHPLYRHAPMDGALDLARSLYRYLMPLALPVAQVDVAHSSAAAFCALPALAAKLRDGVPLVLTEHGVYLRERVLQLLRDRTPTLRKILFSNLYRGVVRAAYDHADIIVPVCSYNTRWEQRLAGQSAGRIRVIHNGVDSKRFSYAPPATARPTVAFVGRIDPLKDVLSLITAAEIVRERVPDVLFRLYGADSEEGYGRRCREAVATAGLQGTVRFEGRTADTPAAYRNSDVVALSSISEGFPFTVVEAMMSGRPVVGTAVGGVPEALGDPGLLVPPRDPRALGDALCQVLLRAPSERTALGAALRSRATTKFSRDRFLTGYDALYEGAHGRRR
ncbi:MAG: GT4 family glycosyltransferase PelF [Streptosporangiaceae bacterium]